MAREKMCHPAEVAFPGKIAFASSRDGNYFEIYWMSASGGSQTRLTGSEAADVEPSWQLLP